MRISCAVVVLHCTARCRKSVDPSELLLEEFWNGTSVSVSFYSTARIFLKSLVAY